jgi:hypothetical protein
MVHDRRKVLAGLGLLAAYPAWAADRISVVATFSVLGE